MGLAFGLAVGVEPTKATAGLRAVLGAAELAAKDAIAVGTAVLPADQHPLCARLVDRPGVFPRHFGSLRKIRSQSMLLLQ